MNETLNQLIIEEIEGLTKFINRGKLIKESQTLEQFLETSDESYDMNDFEGLPEYEGFYPFLKNAASKLGFKKPTLFLDSNSSIDYFTDEINKNKKLTKRKEFENFDIDYAVYEVHGMKVLYMDVTPNVKDFFYVKQIMIDMDALEKSNIQENTISNLIKEQESVDTMISSLKSVSVKDLKIAILNFFEAKFPEHMVKSIAPTNQKNKYRVAFIIISGKHKGYKNDAIYYVINKDDYEKTYKLIDSGKGESYFDKQTQLYVCDATV